MTMPSDRSSADAFVISRARVAQFVERMRAPPEIASKLRAVLAVAIMKGTSISDRDLDRIGIDLISQHIKNAGRR